MIISALETGILSRIFTKQQVRKIKNSQYQKMKLACLILALL